MKMTGTHAGTGSGPQPWWNPQRPSGMPFWRYGRREAVPPELADRSWPGRRAVRAPLWCSVDLRDGNQALRDPMTPERKRAFFNLLTGIGVKEIEVGYPSASQADFDFVRSLIDGGRIPADVTISVFTPARPELIERTFEAVRGAERSMIHLCNAVAPAWRELVFRLDRDAVKKLAVDAAVLVAERARATMSPLTRFEYSPEAFNVTETEYALEVCTAVCEVWEPTPDRPVTVNLPATVETATPNVFADQIEWMHRRLPDREAIILSVHPHNDRGTAVASAELAVLAGADRVEGTLFGNGERTGNVCLVTLALNLLSAGVDPQLDLADLDGLRAVVQACNGLPVHERHPYAGDLVYTAFSGTHQDAIDKGFAELESRAVESGRSPAELAWDVPYLPVDPRDVGRTYESVIRVNSQSGKGGIAYVLLSRYGVTLPRPARIGLAKVVQRIADAAGGELTAEAMWAAFLDRYVGVPGELTVTAAATGDVIAQLPGPAPRCVLAPGDDDAADQLLDYLRRHDRPARIVALGRPQRVTGTDQQVVFAEVRLRDHCGIAAGLAADPATARLLAVAAAINDAAAISGVRGQFGP